VNSLDQGQFRGLPLALDIRGLAPDHACPAGAAGQFGHCGNGHRRILNAGGQDLKRQHHQGITGQDSLSLAEGLVARRSTPTQVIVVHRRQVVVHQGEGMDALQGDRRRGRHFGRAAAQLADPGHNERPGPFAASLDGVVNGLGQGRRDGLVGREHAFQHGLKVPSPCREYFHDSDTACRRRLTHSRLMTLPTEGGKARLYQ